MPGVPEPLIGPLGAHWSAILAAIRANSQQTAALAAGSMAGIIPDRNGNAMEVFGPNLLQAVTIGADIYSNPAAPIAGVQVTTGLANATAGRAVQSQVASAPTAAQLSYVHSTITTTKGSTAATLASGTGFVNNMVIGAANVKDPSSGIATPAITPGTTISSGGGTTSIVLSTVAAESGSALYCAACFFVLLT